MLPVVSDGLLVDDLLRLLLNLLSIYPVSAI